MRVGNYLKQIREEKKVTLDTVSHKTKINTRSLEALENNNFDTLPNKVYVIAYVKNYCKSLGIDNSKALELLNDEYGTTEEESIEETASPISSSPRPDSSSDVSELISLIVKKLSDKRIIFSAIFLIIVISLTFKIKEIVDRKLPPANVATQEANTPIEEIDADNIPAEDKKELDKVIADDIKENEKPEVAAQNTNVVKEEAVKEKAAVESKPEPKVEEKKKEEAITEKNDNSDEQNKIAEELKRYQPIRNTMYILDPNANEVNDPDIYPVSFKNQVDPNKHNVFITALFDDVWYRYKIDNKPVRQNTLKQGKKIMLTGNDLVMVFLGNFFATKVIYNNNLVTGNAPAGVKSLIFPHEKRTEHYLPLFAKDKDGGAITAKEFVEANSN